MPRHSLFYQAEDGIRDWSVTGVQTCALPISVRDNGARPRYAPLSRTGPLVSRTKFVTPRSEERRVGRESRCRCWPEAYAKNPSLAAHVKTHSYAMVAQCVRDKLAKRKRYSTE